MQGIIYALASPDGEIRYCGKTARKPNHRMSAHRSDAYRHRHRHVCNWLRSIYDAGKEPKFMVCEIVSFDGLDRAAQLAKLNEAERRWIEQLRALGFRLTNATNGGDGTHGRQVSEVTLRKMSASQAGRKLSAERVEQIRQSARNRKTENYKSGPENPRYGKPQVWRDPAARIAKILSTKAAWSEERKESATSHLKGNRFAKRKLSLDQVEEIRTSTLTQSALAKMYSVSQSTISFIKTRKRWSQPEIL